MIAITRARVPPPTHPNPNLRRPPYHRVPRLVLSPCLYVASRWSLVLFHPLGKYPIIEIYG